MEYKDYILFSCSLLILLVSVGLLFYYFNNKMTLLENKIKDRPVVEVQEEKNKELYAVNIKGEVKKPGVYYLQKDKRVIDVVKKAGGFTKSADSFVNNLSMKITDEMVIVIYSKSEIEDYTNTKEKETLKLEKCKKDIIVNNSCIESNSKDVTTEENSKPLNDSDSDKPKDGKISINTASKEELMTLTGVGESKALAIIEYRNKKKFETIEEIKEVSGIGDALFEKIKDFITT